MTGNGFNIPSKKDGKPVPDYEDLADFNRYLDYDAEIIEENADEEDNKLRKKMGSVSILM
jgi:hypothetical protein